MDSTTFVRTNRLLLGMRGPCQAVSRAATLSMSGLICVLGIALVDRGTHRYVIGNLQTWHGNTTWIWFNFVSAVDRSDGTLGDVRPHPRCFPKDVEDSCDILNLRHCQ